ncbi:uncharacterized protein RCO7_08403 [Rhynchosporium graminicola]|uniref:Tyrosinase copper-binding domain-containing protein n=1 Tax=Rhynchosporium graminicola TaxID=2792576 RepID=A0A1E1KQ70_9HELO|nr:uncharacterized protein RCO7_08403 [Rhynchosporium commune]
MRSTLLLLISSAASAVSGSFLLKRDAPNLPASALVAMEPLAMEDAKLGKDLYGKNFTTDHESMADLLSNNAEIAQSASAASCSANPGMRFEWRDFSTSDKLAFVAAIKCLQGKPPSGNFPPATSRYEDFVRLHQMMTPDIHRNDKFAIWHRYQVWAFEQVLRAECGYNRAFPWWDAARDAGNFVKGTDLFTQPYFGNLLPAQSNGQGWCINSGAFGGLTLHIGPGGGATNHCMTRAVNEQLTGQCSQTYIDICKSRGTYAEFGSCLEKGPHGFAHNGIGGTMSDVAASPSDSVFYMVHAWVDHTYRVWQNADPARILSINGNDAQGNAMTLDTVISMGGIRPDVRVRDIINTLGGTVIGGVPFCYKYNY